MRYTEPNTSAAGAAKPRNPAPHFQIEGLESHDAALPSLHPPPAVGPYDGCTLQSALAEAVVANLAIARRHRIAIYATATDVVIASAAERCAATRVEGLIARLIAAAVPGTSVELHIAIAGGEVRSLVRYAPRIAAMNRIHPGIALESVEELWSWPIARESPASGRSRMPNCPAVG
jgi:hypothetical protein